MRLKRKNEEPISREAAVAVNHQIRTGKIKECPTCRQLLGLSVTDCPTCYASQVAKTAFGKRV